MAIQNVWQSLNSKFEKRDSLSKKIANDCSSFDELSAAHFRGKYGISSLSCINILFCSLVNKKELTKIEKGKDVILKEKSEKRETVPYRAIFTDYMVWIAWLGFFGDELGYQIFQQYGPLFLNKVHLYKMHNEVSDSYH